MHNSFTRGEFDIQPVNERILLVYGSIYGVDHAVFSVDKFYSVLEKQVSAVRTKYGTKTKIIILGDFNARVEIDGSDNITEERNEAEEVCTNGTFGYAETDDNGAELLTFCVTKQFKVMDSCFTRRDNEYGTWSCNRSRDKGYNAALDHILVSKDLWGVVAECGVHVPRVRWNTDHRMVELDLGQHNDGTPVDAAAGRTHEADKSEQAKERAARRNLNKHVLWCRLQLDPDQEIPRMRDALKKIGDDGQNSDAE